MENQPNIISNELDQAPKTWKHYLERLQGPELKKQIIDAMSYEFVVWNDENDEINAKIKERLCVHEDELPLPLVAEKLKNNKKVSVLYHKKNTKDDSKGAERHETIWAFSPAEIQFSKLWVSLHRDGETLSDGDLWTYLTFERNDYGQIVIWAEQIEIPQRPFTMAWLACHKEMKLSEFLEYMKNEESNSKNKEPEANETPDLADTEPQEGKRKGRQRIFDKK